MEKHEKYMYRCLELAALGAGLVNPNPMVGAVIVYEDKIVGEGYHHGYGQSHAEVNAIENVLRKKKYDTDMLRKSTLYVSLEPCVHIGKTGACSDLIIQYHIPYVVIGCHDPFKQVNGRGIEQLRKAGITVTDGILKKACEQLNKRFFTYMHHQRPYIILKWAQTANGFFAPTRTTQKWISTDESKILVHKWRSKEGAVLVGKNTASIDNPQLTARAWKGRHPKRIVIDRRLELSHDLAIFDQSTDTIVFNEKKTITQGATKYLKIDNFGRKLAQVIAYQLHMMNIQSVLVEGGVKTLKLFLTTGLWDEIRVFTGAVVWENGVKAPSVTEGVLAHQSLSGLDMLHIWLNKNNVC